MFKGAASAIKNRLRFNSSSESTALTTSKSTPDLSLKSTVKDPATCSLSISRLSDAFDDNNLDKTAIRTFEFREDPSFWNDHNVQVIIRLRPLNGSELSVQGQGRCVRQDCSQSITWTGNPESRFTFDLVADEHVSQEMLFKVAGVPMVENCVGGYNSCMFAYGQTGSGKTHTMLGDVEEGTRRHSVNCGMTPRVFEYLFSRIQKEKEVRRDEKIRFTCRCSFLEIYNEHILDLLDPSSSNLQIREDTKKGVYVENLTEVEVNSARDVIQQLVQGAANRKVAATNMNRASSRSHSVFTCVVESKWESQGVTHHRFSRLNLVDLAGSERQKSSGAEGERLKEATNINKSLSTLGLVIMNLVNMTNGKSLHVPYRDSKLTFLLQDSLGGNAKTIIIANISPSSCCSLETLSTLKFAQRAKFIKNNAIVNEDASGDVLAMRAQIENLKKEVGRLRSLHNGGADYHEDDTYMASIPGTPGPFKWDGLNELSTPLTKPHKKTSQNEYEIALVGAFRREKDKDITIQSLTAESQAALLLAKQREDEIQGLRMRLRFREDAIKRLQAVASGKISAETHLLKEKEEHIKEIEVLRNEVSCNPEVTRFAMENLRVKEEIRRLKSFYEEGECERLMEQINILQNKLLEALDWKLMHESNISTFQKERFNPGMDVRDDGFLLSSGQEPASPWHTTLNEENEFLRMQAIHNQSELDALHKRLDLCVLEREKLESHVKDLEAELEGEKALRSLVTKEPQKGKLDVTNNLSSVSAVCDQVELKTMVDAIATASEREAEAHETAITLSKENEQLRMKLKVLLDDNNKLIELYEKAVSENQTRNGSQSCQEDDVADVATLAVQKELDVTTEADNLKQQLREMHQENGRLMALYEKATQKELDVIAEADNLKQQLMELHEENDKLMGLYEKAMQERGSTEADNLKQQLWEIHEENDRLMALYEKASQKELDATSEITTKADNLKQQLVELHEENDKLMGLYEKAMQERSTTEADNLKQLRKMHEENDRLMDLYEKAARKELDITAEVDDLKQQLIIGLYETAMQEKDTTEADNLKQQLIEMHEENDRLMDLYEKAAQKVLDVTAEVDNLKQQLIIGLYEKAMQEKGTTEADILKQQLREVHEENDRLMAVYEKAMQEKDTTEADILKQQLREVHEENDRLMAVYEKAMQERGTTEVDNLKQQLRKMQEENDRPAQKELNVTAEADNLKQQIIIEADNLKQQLIEMHEENDRLMDLYEKAAQKVLDVTAEVDNLKQQLIIGLYEKAMQEKDTTEADILKQQLREVHEENDRLMAVYEKAMQERGTTEVDNLKQQLRKMQEENDRPAQKELNVTAEADNLKQQIIIGLYEKAMQEKDTTEADNLKQQLKVLHEENERLMAVYEKDPQKEQQLRELHEENDKLMGLYEKAMQERDELKRVLVSAEQKCEDIKGESNFPKKLVEGGQSHEFTFIEARSSNVDIISENEAKSTNLVEVTVWEDLNLIRRKLNEAQERLSNSAVSLKLLSSLEKTILEVDELSRDREGLNERIEMKQKSFESSKHLSLALQERRAVLHKKLIALKCSISKFVSSVGYFGQREAQARVRYNSLSASINQKKEELARLEICKGEIMDSRGKMEQSEVELRSNLTVLKVKLEEENRRLEKERVLVTIDNIEKTDAPVLETNWHLTSKATDLLKSEEEIPKLQSQIKKIKEKLAIMKKEAQELDKRAAKVENDIKTVQGGIQDSLLSAEEVCHKLQSITHEKEMVLAMQAEGRKEYENMIREYYECVFEAETSEDEARILNEDVQMELPKLESLQKAMVAALGRKTQFLEEITRQSCFVSDKIDEELYCVNKSIVEVNSMLADFNSNDS